MGGLFFGPITTRVEGQEGGCCDSDEGSFRTQGGEAGSLGSHRAGAGHGFRNRSGLSGLYDLAACVPTPISRPMPRKCHLKFAGCFTMQIRCKTMRPTGYLAMVVIVVVLSNDTRQPGHSFKTIGREEESPKAGRLQGRREFRNVRNRDVLTSGCQEASPKNHTRSPSLFRRSRAKIEERLEFRSSAVQGV